MPTSLTHDVLKEALKISVPGIDEKKMTENICKKVLSSFQRAASGFDVKAMLCGSVAKGTWLAKSKDIDMFILFNENTPRRNLEKIGMNIAKKTIKNLMGNYEVAYSEHPYIRGYVAGHRVEIVPAYDTNPEKIKSAVDRTPHHVRFVESKLTENQMNEVRLLKKFCRGIGVYGSDLKTRGFSGYLCELLIIEFENFENLLKEASRWEPGILIDMSKKRDPEKKVRKKFPQGVMIVVDPVDKNRNVASVVSAEKFMKFVKGCKEFLKTPEIDFFEEKKEDPPTIRELKDSLDHRETKMMMIKFRAPVVQEDVLWPQLRKFRKRIVDVMEDQDFAVMRSDVWSDGVKCILVLELLNETLPNIQVREGPSIFDKQGTVGFMRRYEGYNIFIQKNKWYVEYSRKHREALALIREFLTDSENSLSEKGIPGRLAREITHGIEIFRGVQIHRPLRRYDDFRLFMKNYLNKTVI